MPSAKTVLENPRMAIAYMDLVIATAESIKEALRNTTHFEPPSVRFPAYASGFVSVGKQWVGRLEENCAEDPKQGRLV